MHIWSAIVGALGLAGTSIWVGYHSRQRQHVGLQRYWYIGLAALLPAWLLAFLGVLTPPAGQEAFATLPTAGIRSITVGLLGIILMDWAVRRLGASQRARAPIIYWLLGVAALAPAWCITLISLYQR